MQSNLTRALTHLREGGYTCVLCRKDETLTATERGVKPLLDFLASGQDFSGFCAADRVVGKAAAFLYVLMGIDALHAEVLSVPAQAVLARYGIPVTYTALTEAIRNRTGDGFCPMEQAVWSIDDPQCALAAIEQKRRALQA